MQDTKVFTFPFGDRVLQPQKPWQPCNVASPALTRCANQLRSLQPGHSLQGSLSPRPHLSLQFSNLLFVQALTACEPAAEPCPRADYLS